jgi:hypothetical protein
MRQKDREDKFWQPREMRRIETTRHTPDRSQQIEGTH